MRADPFDAVERHQSEVWRYLRYLGADGPTADDLTQETFLELFRRPPEPRGERALAAWLRTVARHLLLKLRRRMDRLPDHLELEAAEAVWAEHAVDDGGDRWRQALRACTQQLQGRSREAIELRYGRGLDRERIGEALGLGVQGVKSLLQRVRRGLRECVQRRLAAGDDGS